MAPTASTLLLRNLHDVFGEIDPVRRRTAIDEVFHEDAVFYEPKGAYRGRDEICRIAGVIKAGHRPRSGVTAVAFAGWSAAPVGRQRSPEPISQSSGTGRLLSSIFSSTNFHELLRASAPPN